MKRPKYKVVLIAAATVCLSLATLGAMTKGSNAQDRSGYLPNLPRFNNVEKYAKEPLAIRKADGEELHLTVELAVTPAQLEQGLMYRDSLPDEEGMLFLFNSKRDAVFWMKNTLIPLDMLFIASDGTIHHIHHNAKPQDKTRIKAEYKSQAVLELAGGAADRFGIKEGDVVLYPAFRTVGVQH